MGKGLFEGWHIVILIVLLVLLFGFKRLPDAARSLGRSMRVFKSEVDELKKDNQSAASKETVRGETTDPVDDRATGTTTDGNAVHEDVPRTDNQSGQR
jgi:sec-independent protein translocase protein TatA